MQILLASAKIMRESGLNVPEAQTVPLFADRAFLIAQDMLAYSVESIAEMLGCSVQIAAQNRLRYLRFLENAKPLPALLAYQGQAYRHLKADTLSEKAIAYSQQHLFITSFLYGLLRPLDGIHPYRMEGSVELPCSGGKNLFSYWKPLLTDVLIDAVKSDDGVLLHLTTEEYQHLFDWKRVCREVRVVQPLFYVRKNGMLKIQAVWAKTCRGAMTRFVLENELSEPADLRAFSYEGFRYNAEQGEPDFPYFVKD